MILNEKTNKKNLYFHLVIWKQSIRRWTQGFGFITNYFLQNSLPRIRSPGESPIDLIDDVANFTNYSIGGVFKPVQRV